MTTFNLAARFLCLKSQFSCCQLCSWLYQCGRKRKLASLKVYNWNIVRWGC
ncbi:hypothetical protein M758_3G071700 [Ceratodon purpureus]|uniref:Uncharacterized protein n=1 Tax=Ceratodon purpureus TaxID=3225 RepID=A0A8T0IFN8_CERPU|nr:hypothetical protein KC19_3G071300 [Ceratodon purpureus]KAG0622091.1 hypothetical protein M758_3G071700 [Ceratodon purpureus]